MTDTTRPPGARRPASLGGALIVITALATGLVMVAIGYSAFTSSSATREAAANTVLFETLHGRILLNDQTLTHHASMAAYSGDGAWRVGYDAAATDLDHAIEQANGLAESVGVLEALAATSLANQALITYERAVFAHVLRQRPERAVALISSPEYADYKTRYTDGMADFLTVVHAALHARFADAKHQMEGTFLAAIISLAALSAVWCVIVLNVRRQARQLAAMRQELERAHASLATRARLREASFFDDGPIPMFDLDQGQLVSYLDALRSSGGVTDLRAWVVQDPRRPLELVSRIVTRRINAAAVEAFQIEDANDVVGNTSNMLREEFVQACTRYACDLWDGATPRGYETRLYRSSGEAVDVIIHVRASRDDPEVSALASIVDVTELKAAERAAQDAREAAEQASRAKSVFLAAMSHEIRTPMNGVLGMAAALQSTPLSDKQAGMLDVILASGEGLMTVLNDLLDISKVEAGRMDLEETSFLLDDIVGSVEALFAPRAAEKNLAFEAAIADDARACFVGDSGRLRQILFNLVSNALKFTETGGVTIMVERDTERAAPEGRARIAFSVHDTGIGMEPDVLDTVFRPFVQADASTTRQFGGTGLGLAISQKLCELMNGEITARSTLNLGSSFRFVVELGASGNAQEARIASHESRVRAADEAEGQLFTEPLRVLAAEDNHHNQLVLEAILGSVNVALTIVENGVQAVEAWRAREFDLILMDARMPVMDGPTAARAIRAAERKAGRAPTPIIALTANSMPEQARAYAEAGMNGLVAKPVHPGKLLDAMAAAMTNPAEPNPAEPNIASPPEAPPEARLTA